MSLSQFETCPLTAKVDPSTPRDGTRRNPFQQDSTRFRNEGAEECGETLGGGTNNVQTGTAEVMAQNGGTLPQVSPGGQISMTLHQVNAEYVFPASFYPFTHVL